MGVYNEVKSLPDAVTLNQIIQSIPKEAFEKDNTRAARSILVTILSVAFGLWILSICPIWFLPFAWFYTGTAATGLFVIGHDCGHRSLVKSTFWNDVIVLPSCYYMSLLFRCYRLPVTALDTLFIPGESSITFTTRTQTNTAWQPITEEFYKKCSLIEKFAHRITRGPVWFIGSIGHWAWEHFNVPSFKAEEMAKVKSSIKAVNYYSLLFFPILFYFVGLWGIIKYWFVPFLGFHFWVCSIGEEGRARAGAARKEQGEGEDREMSTFTLIHHTAPHIPFLPENKWRPAVASLQHTIHCKYPAWIDFLCHDISVHVPHHVSSAIPHYRLRLAYDSLKKNWGPIVSNCQIHDDETRLYKTFSKMLQSVGLIHPTINVPKHENPIKMIKSYGKPS